MASQLEEERKQYEEQLEIVAASLNDDPGNAELQALKDELDQMIQMIDESLAELKPKQQQQKQQTAAKPAQKPAAAPSHPPPPPPPQQEKWSRENHPAFKKPAAPTPAAATPQEEEKEQIIHYQVNDTVMAKWVSGDKGFYPARITAVTGSSTKPIYTVKFKSYDTIETLGARDIRPVGGATAGQKRKAEEAAAPPAAVGTTTTTSSDGVVLAAPATVYPQEKKEGDEKPVKKFKKIKATKELEKGKSKWQEFNAKAAGKLGKQKKDSMFRTPEGVGGRVGFTGSGQAMRKDPTRTRHIYQPAEDQD